MKTTRRSFIKSMAATGLTLSVAPIRGFGQPAPIRIGHQAPLTGFLAGFGFWHNEAIKAAIDRVNSTGGANGRNLELTTTDTTSNANVAADVLQEDLLGGPLFEDPVDFVIGTVLSDSNILSAPLIEESRTVYFPQGVATPITGFLGNRWLFKSYHTAQGAIEAGWRWALDNLGRRWTIIHAEIAFAQAQAEAWAAKLEEVTATVVDTIPVPFDPTSPPEFSQFLNLIDRDASDGVYHAFTARDTVAFLQQATEFGLKDDVSLLSIIEGIDILDVNSSAFDNTYYITSYPRSASQVPANLQSFDDNFRQAVGIGPDGKALSDPSQVVPVADLFGSWQAIHLIQQIVNQTGWQSRDDHPSFIQALEGFLYDASFEFPQGSGFIRADDHQAFHPHYIEQVVSGSLVVQSEIPQENSFYVPTVDCRDEPL